MSLRLKLILLFLLFALIPTFQLYWASRSMLSSTLAVGLNRDVVRALAKAQEVSERLTDKEKEGLVADLSQISENAALAAALASGDQASALRLLKSSRALSKTITRQPSSAPSHSARARCRRCLTLARDR